MMDKALHTPIITIDEYEHAIYVVKLYHQQVETEIDELVNNRKNSTSIWTRIIGGKTENSSRYDFNLSKVKEGDYLISVKTNNENVTKGKAYIVCKSMREKIKIIDDIGLPKLISRQNRFMLWSRK